MENHLGHHAVVIGGSMAGLMTARVLANHFAQVTVLERDYIDGRPAVHKSIPQGHHIHALLLGGLQILSSLYPDFTAKLEQLGAVRCRLGQDMAYLLPDGKAYSASGVVREPRDLGLDWYLQSRELLEHCVRQCTRALAKVRSENNCTVQGLSYNHGRVDGIRYSSSNGAVSLAADLVVDAGGRGSHVPRWLRELGFRTPAETTIGVDLAYASAKFKIPPYYDEPERVLGAVLPNPQYPNGGAISEIEEDTWHVSLVGRFGQYPPTDEAGFFAFAKSLHTPKLYELLKDAERITDIVQHRFPTSVQRHYERLTAFPEGLLVLGDALCSFNPAYGQGMSVAALQVKALQQVLTERAAQPQGLDGLAQTFFPKVAEVITTPWLLAANLDLLFPQTKGERPPDLEEGVRYFAAVDALTKEDVEVHRLLTEVFQLTKPLSVLNEEPLRSRALEQLQKQARA
jgi:2-polyprenyl-6-methoxyphenol hydroxylase-like FAD-dependent oxidoreductase